MLDPITQPEDTDQGSDETESARSVEAENHVPASPPRSHRKVLLITGLLLAGLCLCSGSLALLVWRGTVAALDENNGVGVTIDRFMQAASRGDVESAYDQFSERGKHNTPLERLQEFFSHPVNNALFAGYQRSQVENVNVTQKANSDPNAAQGTVAEINGTLTYEGGYTGNFEAMLEREGNGWKLYGINVTVQPQKIEDFLKAPN
jgi:hypothetical protein